MTDAPKIALSPADMDRLSKLAFMLGRNEKTRAPFADLVKQVNPTEAAAFGDVFLEQKIEARFQKWEDDRLAERMQLVKQRRDHNRAQIIAKRKFTQAQVEAVDKIVQHYNLPDWEAGADIYAQRNPPPNPALQPPPEIVAGGQKWTFPTVMGQDGKMLSFKDFKDNAPEASRSAAIQVITEFMRNRAGLSPAFAR